MGSTKTEKESIKWICDLSCLVICVYLYSTQDSLPVTIGNFSNSMASKVIVTRKAFSRSLNKIYPHGAQEWNVNWMNKTGGEK